jgi:hypothetical protein
LTGLLNIKRKNRVNPDADDRLSGNELVILAGDHSVAEPRSGGISGWFSGRHRVTVWQLFHYRLREGSNVAFAVQVRFWFLKLLHLALSAPMHWLYWIPTIGTWAQLLFGYCTMARLVSLFLWNRSEPFSLNLVRRTYFSAPVRGNILQGLPPVSQG